MDYAQIIHILVGQPQRNREQIFIHCLIWRLLLHNRDNKEINYSPLKYEHL